MARTYVPRDVLGLDKSFGRYSTSPHPPDPGVPRSRLLASYVQHRIAHLVLTELARRDETYADLARRLACGPDQVRRKLYGLAPVTLEDIVGWLDDLGMDELLPGLGEAAQEVAAD